MEIRGVGAIPNNGIESQFLNLAICVLKSRFTEGPFEVSLIFLKKILF